MPTQELILDGIMYISNFPKIKYKYLNVSKITYMKNETIIH